MKSKFSQTMQDFSRAVIVPVKFMAVMGLFLAVSVNFTIRIHAERRPDFWRIDQNDDGQHVK